MKRRTMNFSAIAAVALLAGCGTGGVYNLTVVPSTMGVQTPKSLVQSGSTAKALARDLVAGGGMMGSFVFDGEGTSGYHWVKQGMWEVQKRLARAAWNLVLVDSIVSGQKLQPSPTTIKGQSVTWTQDMVDACRSLVPTSFATDPDFENAARLPIAGQTSDLPDFVYDLVPASDTVNSPSYAYSVTFSSAGDGGSDGENETKTLFWSADKTRVKFVQTQTEASSGAAAVTEENYVAFDATSGTEAAGRIDEHGSMQLRLKSDPASSSNGVFIEFDASLTGGDSESVLSAGGGSVVISAQGYADGSGGTLTETISVADSSGTGLTLLYLRESFSATGGLLAAATSSDGSNWTSIYSVSGGSALGSPYETELGEVRNQDFSPAGSEVNAEFRQHRAEIAASTAPTVLEIAVANPASLTVGPWVASSDANFSTLIGAGYVKDPGELRIAFGSLPSGGFYVAPFDPSSKTAVLASALQASLK